MSSPFAISSMVFDVYFSVKSWMVKSSVVESVASS